MDNLRNNRKNSSCEAEHKYEYAKVYLQEANLSFDKLYTYIIPEELSGIIKLGHRVKVPFGRQNTHVNAFIYSLHTVNDDCEKQGTVHLLSKNAQLAKKNKPISYKKIIEITDPEPWLNQELLTLAKQMSIRYNAPFGTIASKMMPPQSALNDKKEKLIQLVDREKATAMLELADFPSMKQMRVIENLLDYECPLMKSEILNLADCGPSVLKSLIKKNIIEEIVEHIPAQLREIQSKKSLVNFSVEEVEDLAVKKELTEEQASVLNSLIEAYEKIKLTKKIEAENKPITESLESDKIHYEFLLKGVTGSGKTEVFLQLCEYLINKGEKIIILVPEISLTPQMTHRFEARFKSRVALLHSRLRPYERLHMWRMIKNNEVDIALGPRSAIFAPFDKPALIIIDEEHEASYINKEQNPRYSAISVARLRQKNSKSMLLLASATPNVEDMYRCQTGKAKLLQLKNRASGVALPEVKVIDLKKEQDSFFKYHMSKYLINEIKNTIENGEQCLLFLNRRGYTPTLVCPKCSVSLLCPNCSVKMNYHKSENKLICHYCGHMRNKTKNCSECNSELMEIGFGTEKIYAILKELFPKENILRMDSDTTRTRGAFDNILNKFNNNQSKIMVGTQMVAKGHDFANLQLVGILSIDQMLAMTDIRSDERVFQLITQAAGRAGRQGKKGKVILEVYDTQSYAIRHAISQDYDAFYLSEIRMRQALRKPPFSSYMNFYFSAIDDKAVQSECERAKKLCRDLVYAAMKKNRNLQCELTSVSRSSLKILNNRFRWQFTIKSNNERFLVELGRKILLSKKNKEVTLNSELDPA